LTAPDFEPTTLLVRLAAADVDFVVIGGVAVVVQASPRFTKDLDICYATDRENLERLGTVLTTLEAKLRGIEEDIPFVADARTLARTKILLLTTTLGEIDLLVEPKGSPSYAALRRRADRIDLDGTSVLIASIEDLIAMKLAAGRPQDLIDVEALELARLRRRTR
jgi:hypothetical protein